MASTPDRQFLPADFLSQPSPSITVSRIDFAEHGLDAYRGLYAVVLDNVLSPEECDTFIKAAEATSSAGWRRALVNVGEGEQMHLPDLRNSGRIIWDSQEVVAKVWDRIAHIPEVKEITTLQNVPRIFGKWADLEGEVWKLTRPNERMRFLKYKAGEYFHPHCDGSYETPDRSERSYMTFHLYLNTASILKPNDFTGMTKAELATHKSALVGGATAFHCFCKDIDDYRRLDITPEAGRVLLFQHRDLLHSGEEVVQGVKYTMRTDLMYSLASAKSADRSKMAVLYDDWDSDLEEGTDGENEAKQFLY